MKLQSLKRLASAAKERRGIALISVLTMMALTTILVLTFFSLAQNEYESSSTYSDGLQAHSVAEEAVNMVIRQIREATSDPERAWASQPGAIRTWNDSGNFEAGYKLYSDDDMVLDEGGSGAEKALVEGDYEEFGNWDQTPWRFVDLNEPVIRGEKVYYPIVDPTAREIPEWPKPMGGENEADCDDRGIEGFSYTLTGKNTVRGDRFDDRGIGGVAPGPMQDAVSTVKPPDGVPKMETLPMPAMWIYQLENGSLGTMDAGGNYRGEGTPSKDNPIVSRFAFWADDETCKLNPNVHAGGASWGTPMAGGDIDRESLARFQPAQHEWQRYPGHPATTHLAPVLAPGVTDITLQRAAMEMIFALVPRVVGGGSMSGTRKVNPNDPAERNGLIADKDRLYASLDEFIMRPDREPNKFPDPETRSSARTTKFMQDHLERSKFFLTVTSRAPEVTVFNTPRVSIWPTYWHDPNDPSDSAPPRAGLDPEKYHTTFDRMIRFCAELGSAGGKKKFQYHFQRFNADSQTDDFDEIDRNEELFAYLDKMTSADIPGVGGNFASKYGNERIQILAEIFDYIRCTNLHDDSLFGENWEDAFISGNTANHYTYTNPRQGDKAQRNMHKGHGQVTPIVINHGGVRAQGLGRFYTFKEFAVIVGCCAEGTAGAGGGTQFLNPGMTKYQRGVIEDPSGVAYSNLPPMPLGVFDPNKDATGDAAADQKHKNRTWPRWLHDLELQANDPVNPSAEAAAALVAAFDPTQWNWQLAWLDPVYRAAMPAGKYDRGNLSPPPADPGGGGGGPAYDTPVPDGPTAGNAWMAGATRLRLGEKLVQAAFVWNMFCPSLGWIPINPDMEMDFTITGMDFVSTAAAGSMEAQYDAAFPGRNTAAFGGGIGGGGGTLNSLWASSRNQSAWHDRHYGGIKPLTYFMSAGGLEIMSSYTEAPKSPFSTGKFASNQPFSGQPRLTGIDYNGRASPIDLNYADAQYEHKRYDFVTAPWVIHNDTLEMNQGSIEVDIYSGGTDGKSENSAAQSARQLVQTVNADFPAFSIQGPALPSGRTGYINEFNAIQHDKTSPMEYWSMSWDGANPLTAGTGRLSHINGDQGGYYSDEDVVQSVGVKHGDARLVAVLRNVGSDHFEEHFNYGTKYMAHDMSTTPGWRFKGATRKNECQLVPSVKYHGNSVPGTLPQGESSNYQLYGDFDNGMGDSIDGPYINKPDEGNIHSLFEQVDNNATGLGMWEMRRDYGDFPYFVRDYIHEAATPAFFSPNRILSSPGQFGSLPTGVIAEHPWQTLLFRPSVEGGIYQSHPGAEDPKDHYLLDLFWMPVVEPYAISDPLSTAGKINLNYQILPFRHISRTAALRGLFKSEYMLCVPNTMALDYKVGQGRGRGYHWRDHPYDGKLQGKSLRTIILEDPTLDQFEERFEQQRTLFRSASELCDIHLIPQEIIERIKLPTNKGKIGTYTPTLAQMRSGQYWSDHAVVGDNSRERPYSDLYARVTTKSNSFKVHYRAQVVKKAFDTDAGKWDPNRDTVVAEYRGSSIVERYVEPNDPEIPDYATRFSGLGSVPTIDEFYKMRVVNPTRFAP